MNGLQSTVEMMLILETRLENPKEAALVTCGQNGWVRFWNLHSGSCEVSNTSPVLIYQAVLRGESG